MKNVKIVSVVNTNRFGDSLFRTYEMSNSVFVTIQFTRIEENKKTILITPELTKCLNMSYENVWYACQAVMAMTMKYLPWHYFPRFDM